MWSFGLLGQGILGLAPSVQIAFYGKFAASPNAEG
jgi:hypothetical protein